MHIYRYCFKAFYRLGLYDQLNDEAFLRRAYLAHIGRRLNLKDPKTFNEKLQWLKLHDRRPEYVEMVDKYKVRDHIARTIGSEYLIPLLGVWDNFDDIDFTSLPQQFVLKTTHDSGSVIVCKDKSKFDFNTASRKLTRSLKRNFFFYGREWPYKNVKPRVIAEKYMVDESGELRDYKLLCYNGVHRNTLTCTERFSGEGLKVTFFDKEWNVMPFERDYPRSLKPIPKPQRYNEMIRLAEILSKGIPFLRVDFYEISGQIYFGELTFYPHCGFGPFQPEEWDHKLGEMIDLSMAKDVGIKMDKDGWTEKENYS